MQVRNAALEQNIAVFGESGSGKTVLVSSFYGAAQEADFLKQSLFHVVADDVGRGASLHRNYLGMRDSARLPPPTQFAATSYSFSVKMKSSNSSRASTTPKFDALQLVWHDYPGEWFHQDVSGPEEARRRVDTFRSLLVSDVALLLVDGQRLLDNAGVEERYLKSLLGNFRNGLLTLKDEILEDGVPLVEFPRVWVLALSKTDLLPDFDVFKFRDLLIEKVSVELQELREVLAGFVQDSDALSVGEDYVLLSSAKIDGGSIDVANRVGLDLVLPIAAILPFERHLKWTQRRQLSKKVTENLVGGAAVLAGALVGAGTRMSGPWGRVLGLVGPDLVEQAGKVAGARLRALHDEACAKGNFVKATLTGFRLELEDAEADRVLLRSLQ